MSGRVVDSATGEPIAHAAVRCDNGPSYGVAVSDAQGYFRLEGLPADHFRLFAIKQGFTGGAYGTTRPTQPGTWITLAEGEQKSGLVLRLTREGVVTGTVVDAEGELIHNAHVSVLRRVYERGKWTFRITVAAVTDPEGRFRIARVAAGSYVVRAAAPAPSRDRPVSYRATFYPDAVDLASARRIEVDGQVVEGLNFRLPMEPAGTIAGKLLAPDPSWRPQSVSAISLDETASPRLSYSGWIWASEDGQKFNITNLPAGRYLVSAAATDAQGAMVAATEEVAVTGGDSLELDLRLQPTGELAGSIEVVGRNAEKFRKFQVQLIPPDGRPSRIRPAMADPETLQFQFRGVEPGVWDIGVSPLPPGGYIQSMTLGNQDVLNEEMTLDANSRGPLRIVLNTEGASVAGQIEGGKPAIVMLAPRGKFQQVGSYFRSVWTDPGGKFRADGLTPGEYTVIAFDELDFTVAQSPEFVARYAGQGVPVELAGGVQTPVSVKRIETLEAAKR